MPEFDIARGQTHRAQAPELSDFPASVESLGTSGTSAGAGDIRHLSDEERAVLSILRILRRVAGPPLMSPIERALVKGAAQMFNDLRDLCVHVVEEEQAVLRAEPADAKQKARRTGSAKSQEANLE